MSPQSCLHQRGHATAHVLPQPHDMLSDACTTHLSQMSFPAADMLLDLAPDGSPMLSSIRMSESSDRRRNSLRNDPGKARSSYLLLIKKNAYGADQTGSGKAKILNDGIDRHLSISAGGKLIASVHPISTCYQRSKEN